MVLTATTVGGYLRDLPPDRRVAMARVCSMIRRSARGVRESMRYGLAFYELDGPLFALSSSEEKMTLFVAEPSVVERYDSVISGVVKDCSAIEFKDLNRIPLDLLEKVVRDSVVARRERIKDQGSAPSQAELLTLWKVTEEQAKEAPPIVRIPMGREDEQEVPAAEAPVAVAEVEPVVILRAPTFKDPSMTASSQPKVAAAAAEKKVRRTRKTSASAEAAGAEKTVKRRTSSRKKASEANLSAEIALS